MRLILLSVLVGAFAGCAAPRAQTIEERRDAKARWERYTDEQADPYER